MSLGTSGGVTLCSNLLVFFWYLSYIQGYIFVLSFMVYAHACDYVAIIQK